MNHLREKLVLASSSPRRAEILERAGWPHEIMVAGIDETLFPNEEAAAYVQRLARSKAEAVASRLSQGLVLGADTTVVVGNQILGQPVEGGARQVRGGIQSDAQGALIRGRGQVRRHGCGLHP